MAGKTPYEAVTNYVRPLKRAVSCVTKERLNLSAGGREPSDEPHTLFVGRGAPVTVGDLGITLTQWYRIVHVPGHADRGPWKVSTAGYQYALDDADGQEIISSHWHPEGNSPEDRPHLHLGAGAGVGFRGLVKAHVPTNRIAVEDFLRLAIRHLDVPAMREEWDEILLGTQMAFEQWQTWPQPGTPTPRPDIE